MNLALFLSSLPYTFLALALYPLAHIPIGAPLFLAGKEKTETKPWVLAASLALGQIIVSATTYLLYICGLRFPTLGFVVSGVLIPLWVWGAFLLIKKPPDLSDSKRLLWGLVFTGALLLPLSILGIVWDDPYHFSKVASILNGDHPYFVPGGTKGFLGAYHFGVDFLASFWAWAALAWRPWIVLNVICFWSSLSAYILLNKFARGFIDEPWASILPFLAFWLGSWYSPYGLWDMLAHGRIWDALELNHHNTCFFGYFSQPPMAFGMPLTLAVLCLAEERRFWRAGLMAGPLLLANQALFVFWAGYTALTGLLREKNYFKVLSIGIALAVPFIPQLTAREFSNPSEFAFGLPILWLMRVWEPYPATFPIAYILFFFPTLPLYIHGVWVSLRSKQTRPLFLPLVLITGLAFVAPHFIRYVYTEDFFKFFMLWGVFGLPLALISIRGLWGKSKVWRWAIALFLAPGLLAYALGMTYHSLRTRQLIGWERVRPDMMRVSKALKGKGGVLVIVQPGVFASFGIRGYGYEERKAHHLRRILAGAGISHYPGEIYGKAVHDYEPLEREWASLEEIPDSLLSALNVRFVALPPDLPKPKITGEAVLKTERIAVYPLQR